MDNTHLQSLTVYGYCRFYIIASIIESICDYFIIPEYWLEYEGLNLQIKENNEYCEYPRMSVLHAPHQFIFGNVLFFVNNTELINLKRKLQWKLDCFMLKESVDKIKIGIGNSRNTFIGYGLSFDETNSPICIPLHKLKMHQNNNNNISSGCLVFGRVIFEVELFPYGGIGISI